MTALVLDQITDVGAKLIELRRFLLLDSSRPGQGDHDVVYDACGSLAHHHDAIRQKNRFRDTVRDEDHRFAIPLPDAQQLEIHLVAGHGIQSAERLIHEQQVRILDQRTADAGSLPHAARQLVRQSFGEIRNPGDVQKLEAASSIMPYVLSHQIDGEQHVVDDRAPGQHDGVLEDYAVGSPRSVNASALQNDASFAWTQEPGHQQQQSALSAPGGTENRHELIMRHAQIDLVESMDHVAAAAIRLRHADDINLDSLSRGTRKARCRHDLRVRIL